MPFKNHSWSVWSHGGAGGTMASWQVNRAHQSRFRTLKINLRVPQNGEVTELTRSFIMMSSETEADDLPHLESVQQRWLHKGMFRTLSTGDVASNRAAALRFTEATTEEGKHPSFTFSIEGRSTVAPWMSNEHENSGRLAAWLTSCIHRLLTQALRRTSLKRSNWVCKPANQTASLQKIALFRRCCSLRSRGPTLMFPVPVVDGSEGWPRPS